MQAALLSFCELLKAEIDLLAWLKDKESLEHFEPWFRIFAFNLSSAAARNLPVFCRGLIARSVIPRAMDWAGGALGIVSSGMAAFSQKAPILDLALHYSNFVPQTASLRSCLPSGAAGKSRVRLPPGPP